MSGVGIDKVVLTTKEYRIGDSRLLNYRPPIVKAVRSGEIMPPEQNWFRDSVGRELNGSLYYNDDKVNIDVNSYGVRFSFNPSVISGVGKLNYLATDRKDITRSKLYLERLCDQLSIETDLLSCKVNRIDLTKDRSDLSESPEAYIPVMKMLDAKRMKNTAEFSGETWRTGNNVRQVCYYNRGLKIELDSGEKLGFDVARLEARFMKSKDITKRLNIAVFNDVCQSDPDKWSFDYHGFIRSDLFRCNDDSNAVNHISFLNEASILQSGYRGNLKNYLLSFSIPELLDRFGGLESYKHFLESYTNKSRATIYREVSNMRKMIQQASFINTRRGGDKISKLYDEFEIKFATAV
jgi:hypothetical protein